MFSSARRANYKLLFHAVAGAIDLKAKLMNLTIIQQKIYEVRSERVMLDFDLAVLYGIETRVFNQAVKRNKDSFPEDFMFQLTAAEWRQISSSQSVMIEDLPKTVPGSICPMPLLNMELLCWPVY
jgi:hypothetical protein